MQQNLKWGKHMQLQPFAHNFFILDDWLLHCMKKTSTTDFCYFYEEVVSLSLSVDFGGDILCSHCKE